MIHGTEWVENHDLSSLRVLGTVGEPIKYPLCAPICASWQHTSHKCVPSFLWVCVCVCVSSPTVPKRGGGTHIHTHTHHLSVVHVCVCVCVCVHVCPPTHRPTGTTRWLARVAVTSSTHTGKPKQVCEGGENSFPTDTPDGQLTLCVCILRWSHADASARRHQVQARLGNGRHTQHTDASCTRVSIVTVCVCVCVWMIGRHPASVFRCGACDPGH